MSMLYYTDVAVWQRLHVGPLSPYIDTFAQHLADQGYGRQTAQTKLNVVAQLSRWLHQHQLGIEAVDEHRIDAFFTDRTHQRKRAHRGDSATFKALLAQLRSTGALPAPPQRLDVSVLGQLDRDFSQYLIQERGLSPVTVVNYVPVMRRFLSTCFGDQPIRLEQLRLQHVTDFVRQQAPTFSPARVQLIVTALRSFLRFLRQRGDITLDLAAGVPTVADWRLAKIPKFLASEHVEQLLQSCDQHTVIGQRDYTILLLLARLGLRAGEVVHLGLDDLNWEAGLLNVRGKGGYRTRLPLPTEVGSALARYLRYGRPACMTRQVFVRMKAPRIGFASSVAIDSIVRRALKRAGLAPAFKGAHLLRHSLATNLLRNGASMAEIGQLLRHRLPQTTEIYAKVDQNALATLTQPWAEEVAHE
jgi:site-specific recombinase XerD